MRGESKTYLVSDGSTIQKRTEASRGIQKSIWRGAESAGNERGKSGCGMDVQLHRKLSYRKTAEKRRRKAGDSARKRGNRLRIGTRRANHEIGKWKGNKGPLDLLDPRGRTTRKIASNDNGSE